MFVMHDFICTSPLNPHSLLDRSYELKFEYQAFRKGKLLKQKQEF
jgi:hypothetical protein